MRSGPGSRHGALALAVTLAVALLAPAAVAQQAAPTDLLISEYVEGSGSNKAVEFYNGTDAPIDVSGYQLDVYFNGSPDARTFALTGTVAAGDVFVFAGNPLQAFADQTTGAGLWNGDDPVVLRRTTGEVVDSIGQIEGTSVFAQNVTLRRAATDCVADTDPTDEIDLSDWEQFDQDDFTGLGDHTADCGDGGTGGDGPTDLLISEYVEGSSTNKAVELWNGTDTDIALDGYVLEVYSNANTTPGLSQQLSGSLASGDVFVFAATALEQYADQTTGAGLWNGDDTIVLRNAAGDVVDSFGQIAIGSNYAQNVTLRRLPANCIADTDPSDAVDLSGYESYASDTFDGLGFHESTCGIGGGGTGGGTVVINEFSANTRTSDTTGADIEYLEVYGDADTDYTTLTILEVEGDSTSSSLGKVVSDHPVGTTDADGFWSADAAGIQNGTMTLLLVADWDGTTVLDADQDGTVDATGFGDVVDGVAVNDGGAGDLTYTSTVLAPDYDGVSFTPGGASRIPDGTDTDTAADWVRNDFDLAGIDGETGSPVVGEAYNTPGAPNEAVTDDGGGTGGECGDPTVTIASIQGSGATTPVPGTTVEIEGVVVGDFQDGDGVDGDLNGFHVQDTGDGDAATSDGVFVYEGSGATSLDVSVGDVVHVTGDAGEYTSGGSSQTQVYADNVVLCEGDGSLPAPVEVTLPMTDAQWEALEGMYVTLPQDLAILEYFNFDRFGEVALGTDRQYQPTAVFEPGSDDAVALAESNTLNRITLDDGLSAQNPEVTRHPNGEPFSLDNRFRGGDLVTNATGVLDETFGLYRIQPTEGADFTVVNPRPDVPEVGGTMTVASFNVLNYFTSIDDGTNVCPAPEVGPDAGCRGADTPEELERQQAKIVAALAELDADVFGLIEIQNDDASVGILVDALNAELGSEVYDYVPTGPIGTDAIKVALVYKPATVTPTGDYAILEQDVDPRFLDDKNRPALAQTFVEDATGSAVTVAVNHLKSKGSSCADVGDPEDPDGQGNCNQVRADAAAALVDWMADDPTGTGADNALIIGDLNSYDKEDPIDVLVDAGWTDLLAEYGGEFAYSYVFDGQLGYLDYALANPALVDDVTGAAAWHANADEPDLLDYDTSFKSDGQDAIFAPDPYRASDHDSVLVGLAMPQVDTTPPTLTVTVTPNVLLNPNHKYRVVRATIEVSDDLDDDVEVELVSVVSDEPDNGEGDGDTVDDIVIVNDTTFRLRSERSGSGDGRTYTITYRATDDAGNTTTATATVEVPVGRGR